MTRPTALQPIAERQDTFHADTVTAVREAIATDDVVVVCMAWNPHVRLARKALDEAEIPHTYLEYGNYLTGWKPRLAIKLWSGWPTFPQVFVKGQLVGGNTDLRAFLADGTVQGLLEDASAAK